MRSAAAIVNRITEAARAAAGRVAEALLPRPEPQLVPVRVRRHPRGPSH